MVRIQCQTRCCILFLLSAIWKNNDDVFTKIGFKNWKKVRKKFKLRHLMGLKRGQLVK